MLTPAEWTAIGTVATACVALFGAGFAGWQVWELRRTREQESRPFVIVDIEPSPVWRNLLNLVIENVGSTVARDVRLNFTPPLQSSSDKIDLESTVLLREGVPMLPPGRRIQTFFDASHDRKDSGDLPMRYDVTVSLSDYRGRQQEEQRYVIDLQHLYGLTEIREYGIHHASQALREIEKSVKKWSDIHGRLRVWVRDEDLHRLEERIEHDLTGEYPTMATTPPPELLMVAGRNAVVRTLYRTVSRLTRSWRAWRHRS